MMIWYRVIAYQSAFINRIYMCDIIRCYHSTDHYPRMPFKISPLQPYKNGVHYKRHFYGGVAKR